MSRSLWILFAAIFASLVSQADSGAVWAEDIADGEREFVRQLQDRKFYDLAEQFCIRQSEGSRTPDQRATWQLMLADCRDQHAWSLQEPGRTQILTHAAQTITDFVRKEKLSTELNVLLRVRQIELLATIARIEAVISRFGAHSDLSPLALQAINEGMELGNAMLAQIEQIRRDIDGIVNRSARDRLRYVIAELTLIQARQKPGEPALQTEALTAADKLMKSSGDDEMRFLARLLLAELSLDQGDFKRFDLLATSLTTTADQHTQQLKLASLQIRGLIQKGEPSEALQVCLNSEKQSLRSQELSTFRLEAILNLFELLHKLDAPDLRQKTAMEFEQLNERLKTETTGVWRECCHRIAMRFDQVQKFGPEAATMLEGVSGLISTGDLPRARTALIEMSQSLTKSKPRIAAVLWLQAGNLALRTNSWDDAESDLTQAVTLFQSAESNDQEAVADLLRAYAIGRRWDAELAGTSSVKQSLEESYRSALQNHIKRFPESATSAKAHEWHAMLIRSTEPMTAAQELLAMLTPIGVAPASTDDPTDDRFSPEKRNVLLSQIGEILISVLSESSTDSSRPAPASFSEVSSAWSQLTERVNSQTQHDSAFNTDRGSQAILRTQQLVLSLKDRWTASDDWQSLRMRASDELSAMKLLRPATSYDDQSDDHSMQSALESAEAYSHALIVLASFRQLLPLDDVRESQTYLTRQPTLIRMQVVRFLLRQTSDSDTPIPGDPQLGFLSLELLHEHDTKVLSVERRIEILPILLNASEAADNYQEFDAAIDRLTEGALSDTQLQTISLTLQRRSSGNTAKQTTSQPVKRFWQAVLQRSQSGDDHWLEASLQLALIAEQQRDPQEAARVLKVIDALHPAWGSPDRKLRAAALRARLESPK